MAGKPKGTVYLICYARPLVGGNSPRHYLGYTPDADPSRRLEDHRAGRGAKITAEFARQGIEFRLVRTWRGGRKLERRLKDRGHANEMCPVCRAAALARKAERMRASRERRRRMTAMVAA